MIHDCIIQLSAQSPLLCHEFCGFSAGVRLCFHNLTTCSPCSHCACVCFAVVLANSHLADKSCLLWHGYSGLFMSIGWRFFKGVVSDWKCSNTSNPWLAEGGGKPPMIGPNPSDTLVVSFFSSSMQSVYIRSVLRFSWLPLRERDKRVSESEREGSQVCRSTLKYLFV